MRRPFLIFMLLCLVAPLGAQISPDQFSLRVGYNLHNAYATRFNHLIENFNNERYPVEISGNLPSLNFLHGLVFGGDWNFREDMAIYASFRSSRQFIQSAYVNFPRNRQFLFRENTLEFGLSLSMNEEKFVRHSLAGGINVGYMSIFTNWSEDDKYRGAGDMFNISHTAVLGLAVSYEARLMFSKRVQMFFRPVARLNLPSYVRNLNDFMNPQVDEYGNVTYAASADDKYNKGSLTGLGIESGFVISLPDFR